METFRCSANQLLRLVEHLWVLYLCSWGYFFKEPSLREFYDGASFIQGCASWFLLYSARFFPPHPFPKSPLPPTPDAGKYFSLDTKLYTFYIFFFMFVYLYCFLSMQIIFIVINFVYNQLMFQLGSWKGGGLASRASADPAISCEFVIHS